MIFELLLHKMVSDLLLGHRAMHFLRINGLLGLGSIHILRPRIWPKVLGVLRSLLRSKIRGVTLVNWILLAALILRVLRIRSTVLLLSTVAIILVVTE